MAKASAVQIQQLATSQSIEERLKRIEDALLGSGPMATVEAVEGEPMWGYTQDEMQSFMGSVEQLCNKAGVPWETLDLAHEEADPIAHVQSRIELLTAQLDMAARNQNDKPSAPPPVEADLVGDDKTDTKAALTPPPDTSGLPKTKSK